MLMASLACLSGCEKGAGPYARPTIAHSFRSARRRLGRPSWLVADTIHNLSPPGSPLNLKPEWRSDNPKNPAVCIDPTTGDIHLYGSKTKRVTFVFSFDPTLSLSAIWPVNPQDAVVTAASPGGPWVRSAFSPSFLAGHKLEFTVAYEHGRKPYLYRLQYTDPNDPEDTPRPIPAQIINH